MASKGWWWSSGAVQAASQHGLVEADAADPGYIRERSNPLSLAVTQLRALTCLKAGGNDFAELPGVVTALSRPMDLTLGRVLSEEDPLQLHEKRPLDARALGDLSAFPSLCHVCFEGCVVVLCESVLGAVRHASLRSISVYLAHPAPKCAPVVLELRQALKRLRRDGLLKITCRGVFKGNYLEPVLLAAKGQAPF